MLGFDDKGFRSHVAHPTRAVARNHGDAANERAGEVAKAIDDPQQAAEQIRPNTGELERLLVDNPQAEEALSRAPTGEGRNDHREQHRGSDPDHQQNSDIFSGPEVQGRARLNTGVIGKVVDEIALQLGGDRAFKRRIGAGRQDHAQQEQPADHGVDEPGDDA